MFKWLKTKMIFNHLHCIFLSILQAHASLNFSIRPLTKYFISQFIKIWKTKRLFMRWWVIFLYFHQGSYYNICVITVKCACGAVCCSSPFLLLSFSCIWDIHWLCLLNSWTSTDEGTCKQMSSNPYTFCLCILQLSCIPSELFQIKKFEYLLSLGRGAVCLL